MSGEERMPWRDHTDRSKPPRRFTMMANSDESQHGKQLETRKDGAKEHPQQ